MDTGSPEERECIQQRCNRSKPDAFIVHSPNKVCGTADTQEHRAIPFVVGVGNADTREETFDE
jgi:hypothetical protein